MRLLQPHAPLVGATSVGGASEAARAPAARLPTGLADANEIQSTFPRLSPRVRVLTLESASQKPD